ncbi:transport and Golgi organization protein 1 homolog [Dunckerocampus dactyliophorus]|uniref:transport and Golgi organization protein 1 homolog n=1 Tax=Dunckerocampus dactyliophorus TaxID=161453 RepID=UPI002404DA04|nr:transport and Golgi organization protein 1 homolog [Dunckerocampus dactyliophorus]
MAAKHFYRNGFLLLLFEFISTAALEKRFSDLKRCADEECSMLLCRGKAVEDFSGPDCRFLSFKKSETVYVYYKLSGRRPDIWAGSVGSHFGYFPMDLLAVNHVYTDKEVEIPTEETDFVCFDTGFDRFDNYEIDSLLGSSSKESDSGIIGDSDLTQVPEEPPEEKEEEVIDSNVITADIGMVPHDQSASLPELNVANESPATQEEVPDTSAPLDDTDRAAEDQQNEKRTTVASFPKDSELEKHEAKDARKQHEDSQHKDDLVSESKTFSTSQGEKILDLKTTFGLTFDAVATDAESTTNVTPYKQEEMLEDLSEDEHDADKIRPNPLLAFSEGDETADKATSVPRKDEENPVATHDTPKTEDEVTSTLFDDIFSAVTGGVKTDGETSSEEEDDDLEEPESETIQDFEEAQEEAAEENMDTVHGDSPDSAFVHPEENEAPESLHSIHRASPDSTVEHPEENDAPDNLDSILRDLPDSAVVHPDENKAPENLDSVHNDSTDSAFGHPDKNKATETLDSPESIVEELLFDLDDSSDDLAVKHEDLQDETPKPTDEPERQERASTVISNPITQNEPLDHLPNKVTDERSEDRKEEDPLVVKEDTHDSAIAMEHKYNLEEVLHENKTEIQEEIPEIVPETIRGVSSEEMESFDSLNEPEAKPAGDYILLGLENNNEQQDEPPIDEGPLDADKKDAEMHEEKSEEIEELLEDENALYLSQAYDAESKKQSTAMSPPATPELKYSDSVLRLTLLQGYYSLEKMVRFQKFLGLKNLYKVEAMFSDLDIELQATRLAHSGTVQDMEGALENILETSENTILDEIEKMLDSRDAKYDDEQQIGMLDEETELLDDFQELAFHLRQKYSAASDSTPLATKKASDYDQVVADKPEDLPHMVEVKKANISEVEHNDNLTDLLENATEMKKEQFVVDEAHAAQDINVGEDGGHFNKNKENQPSFSSSDEMQKFPQATLENPLEMGLTEVESSPSGSLDSMDASPEFHDEEVGILSDGLAFLCSAAALVRSKVAEWTLIIISLLPDEWKPGETFFGCPWQAVIITAVVGVMTFTIFFWKTVLVVNKREYLVDEKRLADQIQALKNEKNDTLARMSELQKQTEQLKESQKESAETVNCAVKKMQQLESQVFKAEKQNEHMAEEKKLYQKQLEEEKQNSIQIGHRIQKLEKSNEKLQLSRKKVQETLAKTTVLLDEAKIREDARNVQHKCLEKELATLKEENKNLKVTIKDWEDKHTTLSEQIKVYQKAQKELEDSVVLKDHNVEVLSELLADLDACELQKGDGKMLVNGEVAPDKKTAVKNRIKQMMDVSRVQTTLTVIEEERDRFMSKLLHEEKSRKALEEKHQELEHAIATLKSEKSHVENQLKILQQKNEIMVEMYQQKENALQQRLTKEELERRSKENMLSEVGGKALEAEEQVKVLRQRINEMEEQMKKTEEVYKEQIKEQENKTHSNWVNARNAERALNQEKLESSKLREKLAGLTSQLNERRAPLFRPNSGQAAGVCQGDSYGPSPVSGGAPSPPLMIEGPRRPPSAPVGRRIDPYGPRPPSDPHSRYPDNKHIPGMDMSGPRSSSPANLDGSQTQEVDAQITDDTQVDASKEGPEPGPGSFLASPIRDSPGPLGQGPPPGPGLHDPLFPPGPHGRLPPGGPYRPPRPPLYHPTPGAHGPPPNVPLPPPGPPLPANGHPGFPVPGPMVGEFGPRPANGHTFHPRPGPGHVIDPRGPPPPHFRPPHHFGPMPPLHGPRGVMGPRPPFPPDMRFPGPRDHLGPPMDLPPGVLPHPGRSEAFGHPGARPSQDPPPKQEASQDSASQAWGRGCMSAAS